MAQIADEDLIGIATGFRTGALQGRSSERMCFVVSAPLQGFLSAVYGIEAELIDGTVLGGTRRAGFAAYGHFWLKLEDGRILDPTADQFTSVSGEPMPPVFLGELPEWYSEDRFDPADDELYGE